MVWSTVTLRLFLYGDTFTIHADYYALKRSLNLAELLGNIARWLLQLAEYDYKFKYRPGATHKVEDVVCRLRRSDEEQDVVDDKVSCFVT